MGGFNFGAFAGGLAQGIQAGRELALKQKQLEQDRIKQEQENNAKIQERIDKNKEKASKAVKDATGKVTEATEALYDPKTDTVEGKVNIHNAKLREAQSLVDGYGTPINKPELAVFEYDNTKYVVSADMVDEMKDRAVTGSIKIQPKTGLIEYMDNENDGWYSTGGKAINENVYMKAESKDSFTNTDMGKAYVQYLNVNNLSEKDLPFSKFKNEVWDKSKDSQASKTKKSVIVNGVRTMATDDEIDAFQKQGKDVQQAYSPEGKSQAQEEISLKMTDPEFKAAYGDLSESKQYSKAKELLYKEDFEKNPKYRDDRIKNATYNFSANNENEESVKVSLNYDNLPTKTKRQLKEGQSNSTIGKAHLKDEKDRSLNALQLQTIGENILKMKPEDVRKGLGVDTWDAIVSSIDDNWLEWSDSEKKKQLNKIGITGAVNDLFFTYLNKVNKGAPSNADMEVMRTIVEGLKSGNLSTVKEAVGNFLNKINGETKNYYEKNAPDIMAIARKDYKILSQLKTYETQTQKTIKDKPKEKEIDTGVKVNGLTVYKDKNGEYIIVNGQKRYKGK